MYLLFTQAIGISIYLLRDKVFPFKMVLNVRMYEFKENLKQITVLLYSNLGKIM